MEILHSDSSYAMNQILVTSDKYTLNLLLAKDEGMVMK